ncbi:MAG: hypothetical protein PHY15_00075 [Eubacteriales bacterium]|nr:hypothetical protein [Eubacteriales bacterium]MDD4475505.1 hypothetical protein [Eubacteriales bacterium]
MKVSYNKGVCTTFPDIDDAIVKAVKVKQIREASVTMLGEIR